jgi:hypothetical protein
MRWSGDFWGPVVTEVTATAVPTVGYITLGTQVEWGWRAGDNLKPLNAAARRRMPPIRSA